MVERTMFCFCYHPLFLICALLCDGFFFKKKSVNTAMVYVKLCVQEKAKLKKKNKQIEKIPHLGLNLLTPSSWLILTVDKCHKLTIRLPASISLRVAFWGVVSISVVRLLLFASSLWQLQMQFSMDHRRTKFLMSRKEAQVCYLQKIDCWN